MVVVVVFGKKTHSKRHSFERLVEVGAEVALDLVFLVLALVLLTVTGLVHTD